MGLTVKSKCLSAEDTFDCGYVTYGKFIMELVRVAYGERCYNAHRQAVLSGKPLSKEDEEYWNSICNDDLDLLIFHSDCDGKFTWKECRRIYNAMKDLESDMVGHNYVIMKEYNMFEHWKQMFLKCAQKRNNMYYV